jgi:carbonic anhydrase
MRKLINGIIEFRRNRLPDYREKFMELALGQSPDVLFIACSDSRVVPNLFASTNPGDLFVIRNMGNLVPSCDCDQHNEHSVAAAIEFSLNTLGVKDIVVCGHSDCGAIRALIRDPKERHPYLNDWLQHAQSALDSYENREDWLADGEMQYHNQLSQLNVLQQIDHLKTYPTVQEKLKSGDLKLHGWWFDIGTADVLEYNPALKKFELIDETWAAKFS